MFVKHSMYRYIFVMSQDLQNHILGVCCKEALEHRKRISAETAPKSCLIRTCEMWFTCVAAKNPQRAIS